KDRPVLALMSPHKSTDVLSQPAASKTIAGAVIVVAVETLPGGQLYVSGHAHPGAAIWLYLDDGFVAAAMASADGRFAVTTKEGVAPGSYRVRLDEVEPNSGALRARAEVPFNVPDTVVTVPAMASKRTDMATAQQSQLAVPRATVLPDGGSA